MVFFSGRPGDATKGAATEVSPEYGRDSAVQGALDVVIVTYLPQLFFATCLHSVLSQIRDGSVVVVLNNSRAALPPLDDLNDPRVVIVTTGKNLGFAQGVNIGLEHCDGQYVLLLNDDAWLGKGALNDLLATMEHVASDVVGIVPKVLLDGPDPIIDNVGTTMSFSSVDGFVYNRGYGERDEGQFDQPVEVPGACFAAVLLRRSAFFSTDVGLLDGRYFMYVEDADWCLRARLLGYRFVACPSAVVHHCHSLSTRALPSSYKRQLIRRNSAITVVKQLPPRLVLLLTYRHFRYALQCMLRGSKREGLQDVTSFFRLLPGALQQRSAIRGLFKAHPADTLLFGRVPADVASSRTKGN